MLIQGAGISVAMEDKGRNSIIEVIDGLQKTLRAKDELIDELNETYTKQKAIQIVQNVTHIHTTRPLQKKPSMIIAPLEYKLPTAVENKARSNLYIRAHQSPEMFALTEKRIEETLDEMKESFEIAKNEAIVQNQEYEDDFRTQFETIRQQTLDELEHLALTSTPTFIPVVFCLI